MPSQFFGLSIAGSGLSTYQVAMNTTANNVSNVQTEGYSKQVTTRTAKNALRINAKYGSAGTGVEATEITQSRDFYYDTKYWNNQTKVGLYGTRYEYNKQIENYFTDDGETGFSSVLATMFNNLDTLKNSSGDSSVRNQFISSASSLAEYFKSMSEGLNELQEDLNSQVKSCVDNINAIAEKISILNGQINVLEVQGGYANELRDQRALLIDELSELVPVEVKEIEIMNSNDPDSYTGAKEFIVNINGQTLVDNKQYFTLECKARTYLQNQSDTDGLYEVVWAETGNTFNAGSDANVGKLKAYLELRDGNNSEQFSGKITAFDNVSKPKTVTLASNLSVTTLGKLGIPQSGEIKIKNTYYAYDSFEAEIEIDSDGNETIVGYTFTLADDVKELPSDAVGLKCTQGADIDYMGIPYYKAQMNEFVRAFSMEFNKLEKSGKYTDGYGNVDDMGAFWIAYNKVTGEEQTFTVSNDDDANTVVTESGGRKYYKISSDDSTDNYDSYYLLTAENLRVSTLTVHDPNRIATAKDPEQGIDSYDIIESLLDLKDGKTLYRGCAASDFLQCMYTDVSVDTEKSKLFSTNYDAMQLSIDNQRQSISGVDNDEEALDLVKFQNAYNLSSKVISVLSEMYDRLILNTGV